MASFISSENLSTYLLRELVRYTSNPERGFPEAYQTGDDENLYSTVRNIIAISTKDPTHKSSRTLIDNLVNVPISTEDLNKVYSEIFTGPNVNNPTVRKELVIYLLLKEVQPDYPIPENLAGYLELFES